MDPSRMVGEEKMVQIQDVKALLEHVKGFPVENQKLIYNGKLVADNVTLGEAGVVEGKFMVVMVTKGNKKPKLAKKEEVKEKKEQVQEKEVVPPPKEEVVEKKAVPAAKEEVPEPKATPMDTSVEGEPKTGAEETLVTGEKLKDVIARLCEMGFPEDQVKAALRAAFNNPDRAVEYLFNGIPEQQQVPEQAQGQVPPSGGEEGEPLHASPEAALRQALAGMEGAPQPQQRAPGEPDPAGALAPLREEPQFNMLRALVQQNPNLLQPFLQQLGANSPELMQLITQHPNEFLALLREPVDAAQLQQGLAQMQGEGGEGNAPGVPGAPPGGGQYIRVTPEEKAAIDRLESFGFPRSAVIEAYLACDKDEQLAANYLLNQMDEEQPPPFE